MNGPIRLSDSGNKDQWKTKKKKRKQITTRSQEFRFQIQEVNLFN